MLLWQNLFFIFPLNIKQISIRKEFAPVRNQNLLFLFVYPRYVDKQSHNSLPQGVLLTYCCLWMLNLFNCWIHIHSGVTKTKMKFERTRLRLVQVYLTLQPRYVYNYKNKVSNTRSIVVLVARGAYSTNNNILVRPIRQGYHLYILYSLHSIHIYKKLLTLKLLFHLTLYKRLRFYLTKSFI